MSKKTKIQWCDSTANPIMGCGGCELFPAPSLILSSLDKALCSQSEHWKRGDAKKLFEELIHRAMAKLHRQIGQPLIGHSDALTTTNIYHLREEFAAKLKQQHGAKVAKLSLKAIQQSVTCYAAKLHLNRARSIVNPTRKSNIGYAPTFDRVKRFSGRIEEASRWADLTGTDRPLKPWLSGLPRLTFLSDMGDALSRKRDFKYLHGELAALESAEGLQHLWLWLTKRPGNMKSFANEMGGLPANVCAMTTVTSDSSLRRVDELRAVDARVRGLSIEPLWSPVAEKIDLEGIDWVIVGGESGGRNYVREFDVNWARDLRDRCADAGIAFFMKQIGTLPIEEGTSIRRSGADRHGGDWDFWPNDLKVRELPDYFHTYAQATPATA